MTAESTPLVFTTAREVGDWAETTHQRGERIALVPTMGNLHAGHVALVREAQKQANRVVVSIFVNPTQFGEGEDFERYPRTLDADIAQLARVGVDAVFTPGVDEVYPPVQPIDQVSAGPVGEIYEGASRPGHFDGVLTVCKRLFELTYCDVAVFGEKDAQQLFLVTQMVRERGLPLTIVSVPTVRDSDGVALSSRNAYLSESQREEARALPEALQQAADVFGASGVDEAKKIAKEYLAGREGLHVDYIDVVSAETFQPLRQEEAREAIIIGAVRMGDTRLIDNVRVN